MSGLSLEALNDIGHRGTQMLIILNDNEMSISPTVGAFSKYLSQIKLSPAWQQSRTAYDSFIERLPVVGETALELSRRFRKSVVNFAQPGQLFEDLGITYIGVVPGHDLHALERTFAQALSCASPYRPRAGGPSVGEPTRSASTPPSADDRHVRANSNGGRRRPVPAAGEQTPVGNRRCPTTRPRDAGRTRRRERLHRPLRAELLGSARRRIVAITAGMPTGTGLNRFQAGPDRFFDVGIAEAALSGAGDRPAMGGLRPVVAVCSTFLQRAFDQTVHDV